MPSLTYERLAATGQRTVLRTAADIDRIFGDPVSISEEVEDFVRGSATRVELALIFDRRIRRDSSCEAHPLALERWVEREWRIAHARIECDRGDLLATR